MAVIWRVIAENAEQRSAFLHGTIGAAAAENVERAWLGKGERLADQLTFNGPSVRSATWCGFAQGLARIESPSRRTGHLSADWC